MTEQPPTTDRTIADRLVRRATCTVGVAAAAATALIVGWLGVAHRTTTAAASASVKTVSAAPRAVRTTSARTTRHTASVSTATATTTTTTTATATATATPSTATSQPVATSGGS